jgi:hypothetical protein
MFLGPLPRSLKREIDLLRSDPGRAWTIGALAASCNILVAHSKSIPGAIFNKRQLDFGSTGYRDDRAHLRTG